MNSHSFAHTHTETGARALHMLCANGPCCYFSFFCCCCLLPTLCIHKAFDCIVYSVHTVGLHMGSALDRMQIGKQPNVFLCLYLYNDSVAMDCVN